MVLIFQYHNEWYTTIVLAACTNNHIYQFLFASYTFICQPSCFWFWTVWLVLHKTENTFVFFFKKLKKVKNVQVLGGKKQVVHKSNNNSTIWKQGFKCGTQSVGSKQLHFFVRIKKCVQLRLIKQMKLKKGYLMNITLGTTIRWTCFNTNVTTFSYFQQQLSGLASWLSPAHTVPVDQRFTVISFKCFN